HIIGLHIKDRINSSFLKLGDNSHGYDANAIDFVPDLGMPQKFEDSKREKSSVQFGKHLIEIGQSQRKPDWLVVHLDDENHVRIHDLF
ncbi:unnamed protein product, partial [marine sediment metagenome]